MKDAIRALVGFRLGQFHMYPPRQLAAQAPAMASSKGAQLSVSIVTPVRNQMAYVAQAMDSVLGQHHDGLEYIVMDGGSSDGTREIIEPYRPRLAHFESAPDGGQSDAINKGFAHASGDIMGWLNADDLLLPGAVAHVTQLFAANPDIDVVYGNRVVIDERGRDVGRWVLPPHSDRILSWIDYIPQETLFWRRQLWKKVGAQVDEAFRFAMDWDLIVRFRDSGARFLHTPAFLGAFRVHAEQKTSTLMNSAGIQEMNMIRMRCLGRVPPRWHIGLAATPYILRHIIHNFRFNVGKIITG